MTTDTIPEAESPQLHDRAVEWLRVGNCPDIFNSEADYGYEEAIAWLMEIQKEAVTQACLSYHQRRLAECGGDALGIANQIVSNVLAFGGVGQVIPLIQEHTAKAVEEATRKQLEEAESAVKLISELTGTHDTIATLQKHSEEQSRDIRLLKEQIRVADVAFQGLHERHAALQKQCESLQFINDSKQALLVCGDAKIEKLHKQCEELRIQLANAKAAMDHNFRIAEEFRTRAEKAEAEVAELLYQRTGLREALSKVEDCRTEDRLALTQIQQDVRPLLSRCLIFSDVQVHNKALETFLAKHPEIGQ